MTESAGGSNEFRIGAVLRRSFAILFKHIVPFGLISLLLLVVPSFLIDLIVISQRPDSGWGLAIVLIVNLVLTYLVTAALVYGTIQELRGQRVRLGHIISRGLALMFPVLGVAIIVGLASTVGFILLIIPGLIVMTLFWVAIPAAVVERPGVFASLGRSLDLTRGSRWRVFGVVIILIVLSLVAQQIVGMLATASGGIFGIVIVALVTAFFTALTAVAGAVSYHDLRIAKEGGESTDIVAVYD